MATIEELKEAYYMLRHDYEQAREVLDFIEQRKKEAEEALRNAIGTYIKALEEQKP